MERNITWEYACSLLPKNLVPMEWEDIHPSTALGRVLAQDLLSDGDFPPRDTAAVDGYAVRSADLTDARAARPIRLTLGNGGGPGEALTLLAGEPLPPGCDAVLPLSGGRMEDNALYALRALWPYEGVIRRGEDCPAGGILLPAGKRIDAPAAALLALFGLSKVQVLRMPRAALLPGRTAPEWEVLLRARLRSSGVALSAPEEADLLLAPAEGDRSDAFPVFDGINAEPLERAGLYRRQGKPLFTLPLAPADADATFALLVRPALALLTGNTTLHLLRSVGVLGSAFPRSSPRRRFLHAALLDGVATLPGGQLPLSPVRLARCDCLVELPAGSGPPEAGVQVTLWV